MTKLTKGFIDKVEPPSTGNRIYWDETVKGYGLRVSPPAQPGKPARKVFIAMGRVRGKPVQFTIGPFGTYTEDQARKKAQKVLQDMREGIDPRDVKKAEEAAKVTLDDVAKAYVARPGKLKPRSKHEIERHVRTTFAAWKDKPIISITEEDCRKRYREMLTKGLLGKRPAPGQANQGFSVLKALINYAGRQHRRADGSPLIVNNPVDALRDDWVQLKPRTSRIPDNRVGAVWSAIQQWREEGGTRFTRASYDLIAFLLLTGCRLTEAAALTWDRVSLAEDDAWWFLPDPKNRNPVKLPLSTQTVALLKRREERERVADSPFVFTTGTKTGHIRDPRETITKVSKVAGTRITPHDLRRTFTTIGIANCGIDFHKVELLTNHLPSTVTAKYYLETSDLRYLAPEAQRIGNWIEEQAAIASGKNVVPLRPAAS